MSEVSELVTKVCPVSFSENALQEIKRLMNTEEAKGKVLRVGVKGGGCSGMTYILDFDEQTGNDEVFVAGEINIIMDPGHQLYLFGMQVDYSDGLNARGFVFKNPNATKTCGCGTSFAV